jgi:putative tricarboxylic transport membrane protein
MSNIILGLIFVAISIWVYLTTRTMPKPARFPGPGFFPGLVALGLLATSSLLVLQGVRTLLRTRRIAIPQLKGASNFLTVVGAVFLYLFLSPHIGFFLSSFLALFLVMLKLRARVYWALIAALVTAAMTKALFDYVLHVPLPKGPLPGGW